MMDDERNGFWTFKKYCVMAFGFGVGELIIWVSRGMA